MLIARVASWVQMAGKEAKLLRLEKPKLSGLTWPAKARWSCCIGIPLRDVVGQEKHFRHLDKDIATPLLDIRWRSSSEPSNCDLRTVHRLIANRADISEDFDELALLSRRDDVDNGNFLWIALLPAWCDKKVLVSRPRFQFQGRKQGTKTVRSLLSRLHPRYRL